MKGFEKFLSKDRIKEKAKDWKSATENQEVKYSAYGPGEYDRIDNGYKENSIKEYQQVSFIKDIIPKLIAKKKNGEKVKILDIGAGAGFFTDQIRKTFGDKVEVFSTGLSKKIARGHRKEYKSEGEERLHPNDLKWRSVLELSDFPEFDLIVDTMGEFAYGVRDIKDYDAYMENNPEKAIEYITALIKKLKPGGFASIATAFYVSFRMMFSDEVLEKLENSYHVKIKSPQNRSDILTIQKSE